MARIIYRTWTSRGPLGREARHAVSTSVRRVSMSVLMVLAGLMVAPVYADVVELTTGERIEGKDVQLGPEGASVEVGGQKLQFERSKVRGVYIGTPPQAPLPRVGLASEAVQTLKGLQSVTTAGINYQNYAPRVLEAKVRIDEYLRQNQGDRPDLRLAIERSIGYYVLASSAWNASVVSAGRNIPDYASLVSSPLVAECAPLVSFIKSSIQKFGKLKLDETMLIGVAISGGVQYLWQCASEAVSQAESLLGTP
jgi:hypothetical protein